jgi:hypothetical protein
MRVLVETCGDTNTDPLLEIKGTLPYAQNRELCTPLRIQTGCTSGFVLISLPMFRKMSPACGRLLLSEGTSSRERPTRTAYTQISARSAVLRAMSIKSVVFRSVAPSSLVDNYQTSYDLSDYTASHLTRHSPADIQHEK